MTTKRKSETKYELLPPDGGWGYAIATAVVLAINVTMIPLTSFGLIFGNFLASIGDETTGTTLANGIFNTCFNLTGLIAGPLLRMFSFRKVTFMGAATFTIGSFATIFVTSLLQMIVSFGIIQGLGLGLMFPSLFTALRCYFDERLTLVNSICQAFMVASMMIFPYIIRFFMTSYGFRATVAIIAALGLNTLLAAAMLQPVKWHYRKKEITAENEKFLIEENQKVILPKPSASIINLADRAISVTTLNEVPKNAPFKECLNLDLFKDPTYINIASGLALAYASDMAFISIIPLALASSGFDFHQRSFFVSMFFAADLVARVILSVMSVSCKIRNRYLFLLGVSFSAVFRTAFVMGDEYYWKLATLCSLGFLRCFIQTPLPMVVAEEYPDNFATALSSMMVICGVISLLLGPAMSWVKAQTHSDVMVIHLLTFVFSICVISWSLELLYKRFKRKK